MRESHTPAEIFTVHHRYFGLVMTKGYRLADLFNDPTSDYLEIRDVRVWQPMATHKHREECPHLVLRKSAIVMTIPTGGYEAPARRLYSFVEKRRYRASVFLPGYALEGILHLPARVDPRTLTSEGSTAPSFVPITNVTISYCLPNVEPLATNVVIFRRQLIESLSVSDKPLPAEPETDDSQDFLGRVGEESAEPAVI